MRITGGFLRGRNLTPPKDNAIRPTSDKARLAIFNILESRSLIRDANVVDLFCGTGALGIESISRGAASCLMMDAARTSLDLARQNTRTLGIEESVRFMIADASALPSRTDQAPATLVFMDPPYRKDLCTPAILSLIKGGWLADGAVIVAETEKECAASWPAPLAYETQKTYGDSAVHILVYQPKAPS